MKDELQLEAAMQLRNSNRKQQSHHPCSRVLTHLCSFATSVKVKNTNANIRKVEAAKAVFRSVAYGVARSLERADFAAENLRIVAQWVLRRELNIPAVVWQHLLAEVSGKSIDGMRILSYAISSLLLGEFVDVWKVRTLHIATLMMPLISILRFHEERLRFRRGRDKSSWVRGYHRCREDWSNHTRMKGLRLMLGQVGIATIDITSDETKGRLAEILDHLENFHGDQTEKQEMVDTLRCLITAERIIRPGYIPSS